MYAIYVAKGQKWVLRTVISEFPAGKRAGQPITSDKVGA